MHISMLVSCVMCHLSHSHLLCNGLFNHTLTCCVLYNFIANMLCIIQSYTHLLGYVLFNHILFNHTHDCCYVLFSVLFVNCVMYYLILLCITLFVSQTMTKHIVMQVHPAVAHSLIQVLLLAKIRRRTK